jgi:DNA polymerase (family X)
LQSHVQVALGLDEIAGHLLFAQARRFRVDAYERAAQLVRTLGPELASFLEGDELQTLEGIGPALSGQIQELWNTGSSTLLARLREEHPAGAAELVRVPGMSTKRIRVLQDSLGIRSVRELYEACLEQRVRGVPGFGEKTEQRLLEASGRWLQERDSSAPEPLLLSRALSLAERVLDQLPSSMGRRCFAGALRRGRESLTQLDLLVEGSASLALQELKKQRAVVRIDEARSLAFFGQGFPMKVHGCSASNWGSALVKATGDEAHLAALEARAASRGVALETFEAADESAVYEAVGLPLLPPELRYGAWGIERAEREDLSALLRIEHIRGMVHCHTTYSDGKHSVLEMAMAAQALGMQYITITDHSPSAHYARGVALDRLKQQWDEIAEAQAKVPISILRGAEADILRDGSLDYPDAILEQLDVVIASVHARYRMSSSEMTERLVRALSLPIFKIWGHGLGRILNHRAAFECDVTRVLEALASSRGAIELNADPHRLDLPPEWIPAARQLGLPFVVSVDAHSTQGFGALRYGITMARRGGLSKAEVLNTLSADAFAERVRPRSD